MNFTATPGMFERPDFPTIRLLHLSRCYRPRSLCNRVAFVILPTIFHNLKATAISARSASHPDQADGPAEATAGGTGL